MLTLGTIAPPFVLPNYNPNAEVREGGSLTEGQEVAFHGFTGYSAYLVMFICNHCPYVKHLRDPLARLCQEYQQKGVAVFGINSNDVENYPDDSPQKMVEEARDAGYTFPYLYDEAQEVAKNYRAACTPDFFVFNQKKCLVYRGQFDATRPGSKEAVTGADLRAALDATLTLLPERQNPSLGCNIKWRAGSAPDYFGQ